MLSYNSTKYFATTRSVELHISSKLFTSFDRLVPRAKYKYDKNILVVRRAYQVGENYVLCILNLVPILRGKEL